MAAVGPVVAHASASDSPYLRRFTFIEQQKLKVVEMFFQVDTDGNGELDVWEFEDALVRRCNPLLITAAEICCADSGGRCTGADGTHHVQQGYAAGV
jgi:hypothetical protein